jgi:glycosyltransferase involved in cell wall biosynthesis
MPEPDNLRVLAITSIFPNALDPSDAPYNGRQFGELGKLCDVEVLALVPWFPGVRLLGENLRAAKLASLPFEWHHAGLPVRHPRVLYVPRVGRQLSGLLYTASLLPEALRRRRRVDIVLGAFAYPDGWAAVALARAMGVPAVVKVHGSDINVLGRGPLQSSVRWALQGADAVVAPSRALIERAIELGADSDNARTIPNGVDTALFRPAERVPAREALGLDVGARWIVFVGRLEPEKGVGELLEALTKLTESERNVRLALVGEGRAAAEYQALVRERSLPVVFAGPRPHAEIARWLAAADVLALPSWSEGTPNVVIEALACGRPVVATDVGGIPEVVQDPRLGILVPARDPSALASALGVVLRAPHDADVIAAAARLYSWPESADRLYRVLQRTHQLALSRSGSGAGPKPRGWRDLVPPSWWRSLVRAPEG